MARIDLVHTVGPLMRALHEALPPARRGRHAETAEALVPALHELVEPGDAAMVKGSLSMRMAVLVDGIRALGREG
jgi:UDP-N-acetylmuramoyl-tripeptide--D-alanyl-D-alanine ligase